MIYDTIHYYNQNAERFSNETRYVDFSDTQNHFIRLLNPGALILDFGCGSGRDTKYFMKNGFRVEAVDGSEELCKIASEYVGIPVKKMMFSELSDVNVYDGIWACSSILHLPKKELKNVFHKISDAMKKDAILYTSFKYGTFEGERNGRYFTDFTERTFMDFIQDVDSLCIEEYWTTGDVRPGRSEEKWLNLIMRKSKI